MPADYVSWPPKKINFQTANLCNRKCTYCIRSLTDDSSESGAQFMSLDTAGRLVNAGLNKIFISILDDKSRAHVCDLISQRTRDGLFQITEYYRLDKRALHNYAGQISSDMVSQERYPTSRSRPAGRCDLPFQQMSVLLNGHVGLCCLDTKPMINLGNINEKTIARAILQRFNKSGLNCCSGIDTSSNCVRTAASKGNW